MSIAIYHLQSSIADFGCSVIAVDPAGAGINFDIPHLHETGDPSRGLKRLEKKKVLILGSEDASFEETLKKVRLLVARLGVPMVSVRPQVNSDGIQIRKMIIYESHEADVLIPKLLSGFAFPYVETARCEQQTHLAVTSLDYVFCPIDGTRLMENDGYGFLESFLREKSRLSEVRVEEPSASKTCRHHRDRRLPNGFVFCPWCAEPLVVAKRHGES